MITSTAPHASMPTPQVTSHRGRFWIAGDVVDSDFGPAQRGPLYVEWEVKDPATTRADPWRRWARHGLAEHR